MNSTLNISRFARTATRGNGAVNYTSRSGPIELDHLRHLAPSIFAEAPHDSRSDRYTYIPTSVILTGLMNEGFQPYSVMQGGSRDETKRGFTKHLLRLRHESLAPQLGGTHPEIVLLNSHDGTSSYRLMGGLFRLVCGNGMVVAENLVGDIRIPHKGDQQAAVIDGCIEMLDRLPAVADQVQEMRALTLTEGEELAFAAAALVARYGEEEAPPIRPGDVIRASRTADATPSLWHALNRVQENVIRGGVGYVHQDDHGRRSFRRTRAINGIDQNTTVNRALWRLAEEMQKLKA